MPNTQPGASRISERINYQMAGALGARTTARNLEPLMRDGGGQEEVNGNGEIGIEEIRMEEMEMKEIEIEEIK
ncbi:hypothetical protein Tco_0437608 [Tanacetum coccineum]